jgi:2-aminoethylphosphonate-pyruvate transaminase
MLLLIPGPVSTRPEVRAALNDDFAPWDRDFFPVVEDVLARLVAIAGGTEAEHVAIPLQGCGHFAVEAAIRSFVRPERKILVPKVGQYADRMVRLACEAGREVVAMPVSPVERISPARVAAALAADPAISHVGVVYSETSTGIVHDVAAIGAVVRSAGRRMIVDGISAFGALPFDIGAQPEADAILFSANKCLEGVPGIAFAVAPADRLRENVGVAGSWSFDLPDIYLAAMAAGWGGFRFTPPTQVLAALQVALHVFEQEGGRAARLARYSANMRTLVEGVRAIGLDLCLPPPLQGPIVVNVAAPADPAWDLQRFVDAMKRRGVLLSNFYNTEQPSFRVGCIGAITPADMRRAVSAMAESLEEIGIRPRRAA